MMLHATASLVCSVSFGSVCLVNLKHTGIVLTTNPGGQTLIAVSTPVLGTRTAEAKLFLL